MEIILQQYLICLNDIAKKYNASISKLHLQFSAQTWNKKIFHLIPICINGICKTEISIYTLFLAFLHHPSYVTIHLTLLFSQESLHISNHFINGRGRQGYSDWPPYCYFINKEGEKTNKTPNDETLILVKLISIKYSGILFQLSDYWK